MISYALTVNQRHPWSICTTGTHSRQVAIQKFRAANLQAFFHDLRGKLIHAEIDGPEKDMLNSTALVMGGTVLANVLNAPISELAVGEHVNLC